jgi:glycosyltransferase involved in cell wall biosynthesis
MDGPKNNKIAFVTANLNAYSETFIKAQLDLLQPEVVFHDGRLPSKMNGELIISPFWHRINRISRKLFQLDIITLQGRIAYLLRKKKIDIVLAQYGPAGVAMLPVCKKARIPLVVHFHGFDASHIPTLQKYKSSYQEMFSYAKYIIVVSTAMLHAIKELGCPVDKIVLNTYGINEIFFNCKPLFESNIFFAAGRFVEKKGPEFTIGSFHKIVPQFPDARLYLAGDGPLLEHCRQLVKTLSLEKNVFFPGILKPEMIAGFMQKSIAFVQHSLVATSGDSEGTPVAIMEASAASLPVISTYHAGIPDVILDGITGLLVPEKDIEKMADAMMVLLKDKKLARKMGQAGRERIKSEFSMERYIDVLKSLLYS